MNVPIWLNENALRLLHGESLAEFGGLPGIRDEGLLLSALARPQNLFAYEKVRNIARLAAAYAYGLAKNHLFNDGNKRVAFLAIGMFLAVNDFKFDVEPTETVNTMIALAAGELSELELAEWIEKFIVKA
ncbi:type II toxin-antitoxin system death-on-curing family toxin [Myxosarcina sp. GI1]|uniref:type II toxin-antitoxin system death-on-curing family toxin n=1 Tax=Myxosarcina sp. GI1 TaxID=1541065 RepID=UPI000560E32C|nr:type II toxin-antitoxin system death-on-curing family toxin [Myxosarcina sp. GI1]